MMGFGMGIGVLLVALFWVALIVLAIWLVKALFPGAGPPSLPPGGRSPSAREILDRRYASGELSREQYELMKRDLD